MNSPIWPEFELVQDFMAVLVTCKFEDDLIKSEDAILLITFFPFMGKCFIAQGRVSPKGISDLAKNRSHLRFYACSRYLQV